MSIQRSVCALTVTLLAASCCSSAWAAGAEQTGKVSVTLNYVRAVQPSGAPDPGHDKNCTEQLKQPTSRYIGMPVAPFPWADASWLQSHDVPIWFAS